MSRSYSYRKHRISRNMSDATDVSRDSARFKSSAISSLSFVANVKAIQPDFNVKTANNDLHEIVRFMEINPQRALSNLRSLITRFSDSESKKRWLLAWVDYRGLDLLHCAIINDKPTIITFLLRETSLFPPTHFPKTNPYAHMAATLGYKDSLDALLTYRPGDNFAASDPSHAVKLPPDVLRRLKMGNESGMMNKALEKVVRVVKQESAAAERRILRSSLTGEKILENEIIDLENSYKEVAEKKRKPKSYQALTPVLRFNESLYFPEEKQQQQPYIFQNQRKLNESKVTVYMDVFSDNTLDKTERSNALTGNEMKEDINKHTHSRKSVTPPRRWSQSQARSQSKQTPTIHSQIEYGVRKIKKYKSFFPILDSKPILIDDPYKYMGKTPLTMAAEKNHYECVNYLLRKFQLPGIKHAQTNDTLTLAVKARSPEAIALLLKSKVSQNDYQSAVLVSLREMYPDSLNVLLSLGGKNRTSLFEGTNLFHLLYTQSLQSNYQFERLPEMTRVLIHCNEDVNARFPPRTYPLYTLIQSAFNVCLGQKSLYYLNCLKMLLIAKANPNFDERSNRAKKRLDRRTSLSIHRPGFSSAIHCILTCADAALDRFDVSYWSQIIMQKFIDTIERFDKSPRRTSNELLFLYMSYVCRLGINRRVLRILLRYGANPDYTIDGKYPVNIFFDEMLPFLTKFEIKIKFQSLDNMLDTLLILCRSMSQKNLHQAVIYFLDYHLFSTPIQALGLSRKFCYHANNMVTRPRTLTHIVSRFIWVTLDRDSKRVADLPIHPQLIQMIVP